MDAVTNTAFLGTILDQPDDDAPRLIYADWLDEQGDADRAEFIRLQIRLARITPADPDWPAIRARERDLERAHHVEWVNRLPRFRHVHWEVFKRGFISTVMFENPDAFFEHAGAVFAAAPVREVRLHQFTNTEAARLAAVRHLKRVRTLDLNDGNQLGNQGVETLMESPHLSGLAVLNLRHNSFGPAAVRAVAQASYVRKLRVLRLDHNDLYDDALAYLASATAMRSLELLDLSRTRTGDDGVKALARSKHMTGLRVLELSHNQLGDASVIELAGSDAVTEVRALFLQGNHLTDESAEALAGSPRLAQLEYLFFRDARLTDVGALALARSPHLGRLRELYLGGNRISDQAGRELLERFRSGVNLH